MTCPNCRGKIADGSTFCGLCGSRLNTPHVPQPMPEEQVYQQPQEEAPQSYPQQNTPLQYPEQQDTFGAQQQAKRPLTDPYSAAYSHSGRSCRMD